MTLHHFLFLLHLYCLMLLALFDNVQDSLYHQVGEEEKELDNLYSGSYGLSTPQGLKLNQDLTGPVLHHFEGFPVLVNNLVKGIKDYFDGDTFCGPTVVVNI